MELDTSAFDPKAFEKLRVLNDVARYHYDNPGSSYDEACDALGINVRTYYRYLSEARESMGSAKNDLLVGERAVVIKWSQTLFQSIAMLLNDAVNPALDAIVRLRIIKELYPLIGTLIKMHGAEPGDDNEADFMKLGPELTSQESRFATIDISMDQDGNVTTVDVTNPPVIIDGKVQSDKS